MPHDMHSVSKVQDIGPAVPEPPFISYRANPALHARNMTELLGCVREFITTIGMSPTVSRNDLDDYFRAMSRNHSLMILSTSGKYTNSAIRRRPLYR